MLYKNLIRGLVAAIPMTVSVSCAEPVMTASTTTPLQTTGRTPVSNRSISIAVARSLANEAIQLEKGSPLDANQLVAMAITESSLNPNVWGDHGMALGLFQFHKGTWNDHATPGWTRDMPLESFRVAIRYAKRGRRLLARLPDGDFNVVPRLWSHHNQGNVRKYAKAYVARVQKNWSTL